MERETVSASEVVRELRETVESDRSASLAISPLPAPSKRERLQDHPGLRYLHDHWVLPDQPTKSGGIGDRISQIVFKTLQAYLENERELLANVVRLNDALAKRCDALEADLRAARDAIDARDAKLVGFVDSLRREASER